jgi:RNA polymerase sigma factor (sigma-70 family)
MAAALDHALNRLRKLVAAENASQWTDAQLLERFANRRDEEAFAALVARHGAMVFNVCQRTLHNDADAEDACQATFLILARKCRSIRKKASVGSWLHGVALRAASTLRKQMVRRRERDKGATPLSETNPVAEITWREVRTILDEEIERLPEKFKGPVLLCFLEGKAHNEGAQELGWSLTTFRGRLERARELLRQALSRRGITLSGALLATLLAEKTALAISPYLMIAVVKAALAREAAAQGVLSTQVSTLAQEVIQTMFWSKLKVGVAATLLALVTFGTIGFAAHGLAGSGNAQETARAKDRQTVSRGGEGKKEKDVPSKEAKKATAALEGAQPAPVPAPARKAEAVKGLKLTLAVNQTETVLNADRSNAAPVALILTFTNVGDKPIKLDTYDLPYRNFKLTITGPDTKSVRIVDLDQERKTRAPSAEDFHLIKPSGSWFPKTVISFPGDIGAVSYVLLEPGEYRVKVVYANPEVQKSEFAAGSWTGSVTSNAIVLKVGLPGLEVDRKVADPRDAIEALEKMHVRLERDKRGFVVHARLTSEAVLLHEAIPHLRRLPKLAWLACHENNLLSPPPGTAARDGLRQLSFRSLVELELHANEKCQPMPWKDLHTIRCVRLSGAGVDDSLLDAVSKMPGVTSLHLNRVAVTSDGLAHVQRLCKLELLLIQGSKVTAEGLKRLGKVEKLKSLTLCGNDLGAAGFAHLGTLTRLEYLNLESTRCTDNDVALLTPLANLTDLDLGYNPGVTDAGLRHLTGLKKLAGLRLHGTKVTDAGVAELKKSLPRLRVGK